ncbi:Rv3654c family TadE-like protein, partial [Bifidobacterium mongoliense]|uniref:Rv3654c family TadE-like protein n=1 Tax=Bifidobacterium mongoliense TaxID=518643 RepID=UPI00264A2B1C
LLAMAASVGNLMVCQARARSAADLTALSSAAVLWHTQGDACAAAGTIADRHGGRLASCRVDGEDVVVTVAIPTRVPFAGEVSERRGRPRGMRIAGRPGSLGAVGRGRSR